MKLLQIPVNKGLLRKQPIKTRTLPKPSREVPDEILAFINQHIDRPYHQTAVLFDTADLDKLSKKGKNIDGIIALNRLNDIRDINQFLKSTNQHLQNDNYFVGCAETSELREKRLHSNTAFGPIKIVFLLDYFINRVIPKLTFWGTLYFKITKGKNQILSKTEIIGRLLVSGFDLIETTIYDGKLFFITKKTKTPKDTVQVKCGVFITLNRVGKHGKFLRIYKFRTMFPYSEFLQNYVHKVQGLQSGGKIKDDPRISKAGHFLRKYWLDELPMLFNLIKGDIKLIGVRPISEYYLSLYPEKFQTYRKQFKPGLIPPLYVEIADTFEDIVKIEDRYLKAYAKQPILTDLKYFYKFLNNIFFKGVRSH